ncbi:MAG: LytTR family DNA-binding domain-containing protein [Eubacteriales bacterium]|nr:LytTR family DNA-binding domain-containing protein [Eubacteriales bacterium]
MQVVICDDLADERKLLAGFLRRFEQENALEIDVKTYNSADALLQEHRNGCAADILFMDIYMNGTNGMDAAKTLYAKGYRGSFVFCTTSREHGVESYAVDADGYLLKPYAWEDFEHVMLRCRSRWERKLRVFSFVSERINTTVFQRDVRLIETKRKGCLVHAKEQTLETREPLSRFAAQLPAESSFLSVGQSYLVNLTYAEDWDDEAIRLTDGSRIFMPVREQTRLRRALNEYQWLRLEKQG